QLNTKHEVAVKPAIAADTGGEESLNGKNWEGLIEYIRKTRPLLASIMEHGSGAITDQNTVKIFFHPKDVYFREQLQARAYVEQLSLLTKEYFCHAVRIQIDMKPIGESIAEKRDRERGVQKMAATEAAHNHPLMLEAKALFGGEIGPTKIISKNPAESGGANGSNGSNDAND
ncbi:MAG: hypothetical protein AABZ06_09295, partial [Bdellovibrionota bacterium]